MVTLKDDFYDMVNVKLPIFLSIICYRGNTTFALRLWSGAIILHLAIKKGKAYEETVQATEHLNPTADCCCTKKEGIPESIRAGY